MTNVITVMLTKELDEEFLSDVMITAFDGQHGGCWYWAQPHNGSWLETNGDTNVLTVIWQRVCIKEIEPSELHEGQVAYVDHAMLAQGISRLLNGDVKVRDDIREAIWRGVNEMDGGEIDIDAADVIVQAALFNEIVYG